MCSPDLADDASATTFLAGILARIEGPVFWCLRWRDLFAPALHLAGLHPDRVIYVEAGTATNVLLAQIGRAHVCTPVTNAHLVCRLLLEKNHKTTETLFTHQRNAKSTTTIRH